MDFWENDIFLPKISIYQVLYLNSLPYMHFSTSKDQGHGLGVHGELLDSPGNHGVHGNDWKRNTWSQVTQSATNEVQEKPILHPLRCKSFGRWFKNRTCLLDLDFWGE